MAKQEKGFLDMFDQLAKDKGIDENGNKTGQIAINFGQSQNLP